MCLVAGAAYAQDGAAAPDGGAPHDPAAAAETPLPPRAANPLIRAAADYAHYRSDLAAVRNAIVESPEGLDGVMDRLTSHQPDRLSRAWIAFAATVAAQQTTFIDEVKYAARAYGRDEVIVGLVNDPKWTLTFRGADQAARAITERAEEEAALHLALGEQFKQQSYDLQKESWALRVIDREDRLDRLEDPDLHGEAPLETVRRLVEAGPISSQDAPEAAQAKRAAWSRVFEPAPELAGGEDDELLGDEGYDSTAGFGFQGGFADPSFSAAYTPAPSHDAEEDEAVGAMLALAALDALNAEGDRPDAFRSVLESRKTRTCLNWAMSQLKVCVAAGHFKYEDAFCISEHQLKDVGACFGAVALN